MTMQAWQVEKFSPQATFRTVTLERPQPRAGEVLIEVKAISLNPLDHKLLHGDLAAVAPALPATLHGDMAGIVRGVGSEVSQFKVGDEVYGTVGGVAGSRGTSAEYIVADARLIAKKPKNLSFREAAALPLVAITAYEGLVDKARIHAGQTLFVYGGVGGVGHIAVQMGKVLGAKVTTTVSGAAQEEIVRSLGADHTVNYKQENVEARSKTLTDSRGFDVVFDSIGGENIDQAAALVGLYGHVISTTTHGETHNLLPLHLKSASLHIILMLLPLLTGQKREHHGKILEQVATWVEQGKIKPLVDERRFQLHEINEAHAYFASQKYTGKIVMERP